MTVGDPPAGEWYVRVWADPDYHELVRARPTGGAPVAFPTAVLPREVTLRGEEVRIGRGGDGATLDDAPEVDLSGPPRDPGVSHLHAVLMALPDDRWVVLDPGSTNGVTMNYAEESLRPNTPVPVRPGDRLHLGAWTTLTVDRRAADRSDRSGS